MLSDIASPRWASRQVQNLKGLLTNIADFRSVPPGYCLVAQDVQFDDQGNARPRDGVEQWWDALSQRVQVSEMELGETWVFSGDAGGTAALTTAQASSGYQSLALVTAGAANTATGTRSGIGKDVTSGLVANADGKVTAFYVWLRCADLTKVTSISATVTTAVGTVTTITNTAMQTGMAANVWKKVRIGSAVLASGTTATSLVVTVVSSAGGVATVYVDDCYACVETQFATGAEGAIQNCADMCVIGGYLYTIQPSFWTNGAEVNVYDSTLSFVRSFMLPCPGLGIYSLGTSYCLVSDGTYLYVRWAGTTGDVLKKYSTTGRLILNLPYPAAGTGVSISWLCIDGTGNLCFSRYNPPNLLTIVTTAGVLVNDVSLHVYGHNPASITVGEDGNIYTYAPAGQAIYKFVAYNYTATIALSQVPVGKHFVVDATGDSFFTDSPDSSNIDYFDSAGNYVSSTLTTNATFATLRIFSDVIYNICSGSIHTYTNTMTALASFPYIGYFGDSFCLGEHEFRRTNSPNRYLLAAFGETLYADLNEAKAPYKLFSGLTRNIPMYFTEAENRAIATNGTDANLVFNGSHVRQVGYPAPPAGMAYDTNGSGGSLPVGTLFYAVSFVYGEGSDLYGESNITSMATGQAIASPGQTIKLKTIPVGAIGSGVVKRRIYRCLNNGGAYSTVYLVYEIPNNTDTTFEDTGAAPNSMLDVALILQKAGPIDNGVPPIVKYAKFYDRGMVYLGGQQVYYSRPGADLDSTPETVPAENVFSLPPAGDVTAAVEFNNVLYIFQEMAVTSARWIGSDLIPQPVARSRETGVGAIDQNAVTVYADNFILFKDRLGQLHRLLPNDVIDPATSWYSQYSGEVYSKPIANLLNDVNPYPCSTTMYHETVNSEAQWDNRGANGSIGNNLVVTDDGRLSYQYGKIGNYAPAAPASVKFDAGHTVGPSASDGNRGLGIIPARLPFTVKMRLQASAPIHLTSLSTVLGAAIVLSRASGIVSYTLKLTKIADAKSTAEGSTLATVSGTKTFSESGSSSETNATLNCNVYIPKNECVIFEISVTALSIFLVEAYIRRDTKVKAAGAIKSIASTFTDVSDYYTPAIGASYAIAQTTIYTQAAQSLATIQRYAGVAINGQSLKGGNSISVDLEAGTDASFSNAIQATVLTNTVDAYGDIPPVNVAMEPYLIDSVTNLFPLSDFRNLTPSGLSVQRPYYRVVVTLDPNRAAPVDDRGVSQITLEEYSRVSKTITDAFPSFTSVDILGSTEASFPNPYDLTAYAYDIYTSRVVPATYIASFGKLNVSYQVGQQKLTFQMRTGSNSATILGNPWVTVYPDDNASINAAINAIGDTCFQWRVIFQDDPSKVAGPLLQTILSSVNIAWGASSSAIAPLMPPTLMYYKGKVLGSWTPSQSRVPSRTMYMDTCSDDQGNKGPRFATWTGLYFTALTVATDKLIAGTASGGKLYRLFNSAIGDDAFNWPNAYQGVPGIIVTVPMSFGTSQIKSLYWAYWGMEQNFYKQGFVFGPLDTYQNITDGNNVAIPFFTWAVATNPQGASLVGGSGRLPIADTTANQAYNTQMTFNAIAPNQGNNLKPYQTEYGVDLAMQERAFTFGVRMTPYLGKDSTGAAVAIFPSLTGIGVEFHLDNIRGV
jgi:hypothetical protein